MNEQKLTERQLKYELRKVPATIPIIKKANADLWITLASLSAIGIPAYLMPEQNKLTGKTNYVRLSLVGACTGLAIHFFNRHNVKLHKAVKLYNQKAAIY